jgi:hypothetical protein
MSMPADDQAAWVDHVALAEQAPQQGSLAEWLDQFLRGDGRNVPFADGLQARPHWFAGPLLMPLDAMRRICGPEPGMPYHESLAAWQSRVEQMTESIASGWRPPPLICGVEGLLINKPDHRSAGLLINDGNHRAEALRRTGTTHYPTVLWATSKAALDDRLSSRTQQARAARNTS